MTDDERAEIAVTVRLLRACVPLPWLAIILIGVAALALFRESGTIAAAISMASGLTALVYGIRAVFDARLFDDVLAGRLTMTQLDTALGLARHGRPWSDRCRGARRLLKIATFALVVQSIALVLAAWT
jgi:hypothetical protein